MFLLVSATSFLMLLLFLWDFLFSSTVGSYFSSCKSYKKYDNLQFLEDIFEKVKDKYNFFNVNLLIKDSSQINAFAAGGLRKNVIVLTTGIINDYGEKCPSREEFFKSLEGILAHEMSHIVNRDYFPGLLLLVNEKALNFVSKIVFFAFNLLAMSLFYIPFLGRYLNFCVAGLFKIFNYILRFFYQKIVLNLFNFFQLQLSKMVEYRADRQACREVGGENMARALGFLGKSGFFNIFSSHPKTQNRVKRAKKYGAAAGGSIRSILLSNVCFFLSFAILIFLTAKTYKMANVERLLNDSETALMILRDKYILLKNKIKPLGKFL
jgi:Zn-dependent protease with chaperone function